MEEGEGGWRGERKRGGGEMTGVMNSSNSGNSVKKRGEEEIMGWIGWSMRSGLVCREYMRRIEMAESVGGLYKVLSDVNGGSWLLGAHGRGVVVPVGAMVEYFGGYINGGVVERYEEGYSTKFYCRYSGEVIADATIVYIMESEVELVIPRNRYPFVHISRGSRVRLRDCGGYGVDLKIYGDGEVDMCGYDGRCHIIKDVSYDGGR